MLRVFWPRTSGLRRGDLVEVRSAAEIRATLDAEGRLDGLPFMAEMAPFCGRRFRVYRRADKTCVEGLGLRRMHDTVFLEELRCDGAAHDGCERGCLMFWKVAWLQRVSDHASRDTAKPTYATSAAAISLALSLPTRDDGRYLCQSTALGDATGRLSGWNPVHLLREVLVGELTLRRLAHIIARGLLNKTRKLLRLREIGGLAGTSPRNPKGNLALAPNEAVEVKSATEIEATLDPTGRNQGLTFEPDMAEFTEQRHEVEKPVTRIILEETGRMISLTSTVTLKGVTCQGLCSKNCPRNNPLFWRESWLKRVDDAAPARASVAPEPGRSRQNADVHA